jgi:folate-binding protein YgfZ
MTALVFSSLGHRGVIAVSGDDRRDFLQGLVSNDVSQVAPDRAIHAALLTPQGRFLFDMFIVEHNGVLLLEVERDRAADLTKKLTMYRLRSKVTIENRGTGWEVAAAYGEGASAALGLAEEPGAAVAIDDAVAYVDPRLPGLGVRVVAPDGHIATMLPTRGFAPAPFEVWDHVRLTLGVPDGSRDLPVEKALLLESGFDELHGVDWKKGCYMGQELTARTKYRGLVKKRLLPVTVEGPLPAPGTLITVNGKEAGEMRSGLGRQGLALLRLEALDKARSSGAPLTAGEATLRPLVPEWVSLPPAA